MSPLLSGFAFGSSAVVSKATITSTTGSPTVDTSSRPGKTIYKFTGSGSITVGTSGSCELLVIGGGGGGGGSTTDGAGGGGAGGYYYDASAFLPTGTLTVTVGAGGAIAKNGNYSLVGQNVVLGGGAGKPDTANANDYSYSLGESSGGQAGKVASNFPALSALGIRGNAGGAGVATTNTYNGGAGGGGAGAAGGQATSGASNAAGAAGGNGSANSITGTSVTYAGGGGGGSVAGGSQGAGGSGGGGGGGIPANFNGYAGTANTGGGGGGGAPGTGTGAAGGSGYVIVVVG